MFKKLTILMAIILGSTCLNAKSKNVELLGAGATFPYPFYSKAFDVYFKVYNVKVNYQAIGSGGGIRQLLNRTVDFGATDAFMSDEYLAKVPMEILHIPTCLGAVVITYNLPGNPKLRFTPQVIADIFLGKIKYWNDERIKALNPDVKLPAKKILVIHRSDGSGTTFIFSDYLSKVSREWKEKVGRGKSLKWPVGLGGKGNAGVAGLVKQMPGAIGYVELTYALSNNMPVGMVKNKAGNFILPTVESVSLAGNVDIPKDTRISITNTSAEKGYPISSFTWLILYKEQNYDGRSKEKAKELVNLLWWLIHQGQKYTKELHYGPLPEKAVKRAEDVIRSITYDGKPLLSIR